MEMNINEKKALYAFGNRAIINHESTAMSLIYSHLRDIIIEYVSTRRVSYGSNI